MDKKVIIVTGMAASGKSTLCKQLEQQEGFRYISHDEWMKKYLDDFLSPLRVWVDGVFDKEVYFDDKKNYINTEKFKEKLLDEPELNRIYAEQCISYWFANMMQVIKNPINMDVVIEVPYFNHTISYLRKTFPNVRVVEVKTPLETIKQRMAERNWSEQRINSYFDLYYKIREYYSDIDLVLSGKEETNTKELIQKLY